MILLIDNYDSFSYNLYQLIGAMNPEIQVVRNDEYTLRDIEQLQPTHIIISPGPGRPADAGICESVVKHFAGRIPILGVCLGHQAICEAYGAKVTYAKTLMHGKASMVQLDADCLLFRGLPEETPVARYHSLAVEERSMPEELTPIAKTRDGEVMAVAQKEKQVYGVQFHPESILTPAGDVIIKNFLSLNKEKDI